MDRPFLGLDYKASSIWFVDTCQSQIDADEVERKRAKEIVAIFKPTKRKLIHGWECYWQPVGFPPVRKFSFQPIKISSGCYDDNTSLSYRGKFDNRAAAPVSAKSTSMPRWVNNSSFIHPEKPLVDKLRRQITATWSMKPAAVFTQRRRTGKLFSPGNRDFHRNYQQTDLPSKAWQPIICRSADIRWAKN